MLLIKFFRSYYPTAGLKNNPNYLTKEKAETLYMGNAETLTFKQKTEFGYRLDSISGNLTYVLAFTGIYIFKMEDFLRHWANIITFIKTLSVIKSEKVVFLFLGR